MRGAKEEGIAPICDEEEASGNHGLALRSIALLHEEGVAQLATDIVTEAVACPPPIGCCVQSRQGKDMTT